MVYTLVKEIGRGGFGKVYEVTNDMGELFAKKEFNPNDALQSMIDGGMVSLDDLKKRFFKEIRYQSQIQNRNVVRIIDSNLEDATPWYVMELGVGTLQDDLNNDRTLGENLQIALFDILAGLEAIHELGITHRDLKPVNVLKFINNERVRYAISDFGLITAVASDTTTITKTGYGAGTPIYAAPELITNFKYATATADIYSFGAILHDIFGNGHSRTPYVELTVAGLCRTIVEKCTKTSPRRRYQNVATLRVDLYEALNHPDLKFNNSEEEEIVTLLNQETELTDNQWDQFFLILDKAHATDAPYNIFRALRSGHIESLAASSSDLFNALGMEFSEYVRSSSHDFNYCDVLADKLEHFFKYAETALKAHILLTLLIMGVDHNRWFVERKFLKLASSRLEHNVAQRMLIDIKLEPINFASYIKRWEESISVSKSQLHPLIFNSIE